MKACIGKTKPGAGKSWRKTLIQATQHRQIYLKSLPGSTRGVGRKPIQYLYFRSEDREGLAREKLHAVWPLCLVQIREKPHPPANSGPFGKGLGQAYEKDQPNPLYLYL